MNPQKIVYRDDLILIANKPYGIPVHETKDPERLDFTRMIQDELNLSYLRTANRLDLNTTGIVVFGLDPEKNSEVDHLLMNSTKFYLTLVQGKFGQSEQRIESFLKDGNKKVQTVRSGGKKAITIFRKLGYDPKRNISLLEAELITGRRHQIRIHISESGHPIIGDKTYGAKAEYADRMYLHAWKIQFPKTDTRESLNLTSEPVGEIWQSFAKFWRNNADKS
ncbi:RluA family pseudouridine synthase [Leptospira sp. GIMC2001]|uniref:RluA family pseudouridine synthase n=1 Tax=Leptospira sp. GIMC2001 TaxID=1513297 RepID=UPI002349224F|nr:RNA pseudouridine synthase [Leptospira sp. GIMC2001]WCL50496.1 RNA pseudouridine synthase [Leptospira sp. GIMC2001]